MKFIGLDLAWSRRNTSAAAVLENPGGTGALLTGCCAGLQSDREIVDYISSAVSPSEGACVAIDAPLIIRNETGARPVDREITRRFGRYGAGAHPCNRQKFPQGVRGEALVKELCKPEHGFNHRPFIDNTTRRLTTRIVIEVYPHPAQVVFFGLKKRILYKKGGVEIKRLGLRTLQEKIRTRLLIPQRASSVAVRQSRTPEPVPYIRRNLLLRRLLSTDTAALRGAGLKSHEDTLDALICAYTGLYHWYWGEEKSEVIGDMKSGYIVVPKDAARGL